MAAERSAARRLTPPLSDEAVEGRVVAVVRTLAREVGGDRAASAVQPTASLERDVGLGSLERVELLARLEPTVGRQLDDRFLLLDTPREIARAIADAPLLADVLPIARSDAAVETTVRADDAETLVDALARRARAEPTRTHVLIVDGEQTTPLTFGELWHGAMRIAAALRGRSIGRGDTVAIMLPTGRDYLETFMGVIAAGAIAVPLYPPARLDRLEDYLSRHARILANADAKLLIAMPEAAPVSRLLRDAAPSLTGIVTADALRGMDGERATDGEARLSSSDAALIQYTSGSTGDPKGVVLTHANLLANIRAIAQGVQLAPNDVVVSWLPLYHDMGLIGNWLFALVYGLPLTLMSPLAFLARPERWLWAIHQQRATLTAAPNFAFELCARRIRDEALEGLDLSSWRCALNGAEPVSASTIARFAERFAPYGFRREAHLPVFGLAESAVALAFPPLGREPLIDRVRRTPFQEEGRAEPAGPDDAGALSFVSVGRALPGHEVRLVDAQRQPVGERVVGRLEFRGPSCMASYYRHPEATARTVAPDGWIDSGDLAYRSGDELFITGRGKDLIIKSGRNLVPQEIEECVASVEGIRRGCVAAFGVPDEATGTERLVVIAESHASTADTREALERAAVARVAAEIGVPPDIVRIVPAGVVPKTPSGKVRRTATRDAYLAGTVGRPPKLSTGLRLRLVASVAVERGARAMTALRRGAAVAYVVIAWLLAIIIGGPVLAPLIYLLPEGRPVRRLSRVISRVLLAVSGCRVAVEGRSRLPRGPFVLISNHTSYADIPILLAAIPTDFVFVAMHEVLTWRLIGALARRGGHPTVDRWRAQQSVADATAIRGRLAAGEAVLFFAEGGFSRAVGLKPLRMGAFEAAVAAGVPVVPVALRGSRQRLPGESRMPKPGRIHVWIGEPLVTSLSRSGWDAVVDLRNRAADALAAHCGEPRLEPGVMPPRSDAPPGSPTI